MAKKDYYHLSSTGGVIGIAGLNKKLENLANVDLKQTLFECADEVRNSAWQKAPSGLTNELKDSLASASRAIQFVDDYTVTVGTDVEYAPFVEIGTGIFAGEYSNGLYNNYLGTGNTDGWWWPANEAEVEAYGVPNPEGGYYNAYYWEEKGIWLIHTVGRPATPFLLPSLLENEKLIIKKLSEKINKEVEA